MSLSLIVLAASCTCHFSKPWNPCSCPLGVTYPHLPGCILNSRNLIYNIIYYIYVCVWHNINYSVLVCFFPSPLYRIHNCQGRQGFVFIPTAARWSSGVLWKCLLVADDAKEVDGEGWLQMLKLVPSSRPRYCMMLFIVLLSGSDFATRASPYLCGYSDSRMARNKCLSCIFCKSRFAKQLIYICLPQPRNNCFSWILFFSCAPFFHHAAPWTISTWAFFRWPWQRSGIGRLCKALISWMRAPPRAPRWEVFCGSIFCS